MPKKKKCVLCSKKMTFMDTVCVCKCGMKLCTSCRNGNHACPYNYRDNNVQIMQENVDIIKTVSDKMVDRL